MVKKIYNKSIFIFRRDLRLSDNTGLINALKESSTVIPIFILTPEQLVKNKLKSDNCVQFMMESLDDLDNSLKNKGSRLYYFYGEPAKTIKKIIKSDEKIQAVYVNMDYTPYSKKRDKSIEEICVDHDVDFLSFEDVLLNPIQSIKNKQGEIYTKFTPYHTEAKKHKVDDVKKNNYKNYIDKKIKLKGEYELSIHKFYKHNKDLIVKGGSALAQSIINNLEPFKTYNKRRNDLVYNTTHLSAYIKFGCVSIREVYHAFVKKLGNSNDLVKQLYWRDFYYNIGYTYPHTFNDKNGSLKEKYNKIKWDNNNELYDAWKNGLTGYPIVDACMRELNTTGFMHNRGRLIVSSFLIKILFIDWKWGEHYFAQKLVDYDPNVNGGNWQWSSGSGADSQPYFRIFNPSSQSKKHDPTCTYIKKWVPELTNADPTHIHDWEKNYKNYPKINYPKPVVNYSNRRENALKKYKVVFK